ncbi:MAG: cytochrome P450 [Acidimicrobiales bacterium]|nr:MAG: cytochrome P450 [Acidimicrobiales bacterium]
MLFRMWEKPVDCGHAGVTLTDGHWVVHGHNLIRTVLADLVTFRPDNALDAVTPISAAALRLLADHGFRLPATLANNGTSSHEALRALVTQELQPARIAQHRGWLTGILRRRLIPLTRSLRAGRRADLHAAISHDLPLAILARVMALPDDIARGVKEFSAAALELFWAPLDAARQNQLAELVGTYHAQLRRFVRTARPTMFPLRERAFAQGFSEDEVTAALFFLLIAGQETTSQFLTLLMHRLMSETTILNGLIDGSISATEVVEEGLRLESPVVTWRRVTTREVQLGGTLLPPGASVLLWLAHAGRDDAVVAQPEEFMPGQPGSRRHLAFGAGAHRCAGAQLARMEACVVVTEVAPLLRRCTVIQPPWCPDNLSFRAPNALMVQLFR